MDKKEQTWRGMKWKVMKEIKMLKKEMRQMKAMELMIKKMEKQRLRKKLEMQKEKIL
jgi:hypothetical protein